MLVQAKDGTKLFVRDWGTGEPLLFVASSSVPSDIWSPIIPRFAEAGYRCVSFDRRGHGRSDEPRGGWDIDTLASDIGVVADGLGLDRFALVGHSVGGAESIRYAARQGGGRVTKTVLLAPTGPLMMKTADNPEGLDRALFEAAWALWRKDFPRWVRENARPFFDDKTSEAMVDWGARLMSQMSLPVQLEMGRIGATTDLREDLPRLAMPTLFLHGENDVSVPIFLGRRAARLIPSCRFKAYEGAAHGLFLTHMDEVVADVLAFLR